MTVLYQPKERALVRLRASLTTLIERAEHAVNAFSLEGLGDREEAIELAQTLEALRRAPLDYHPDDAAVDRFAADLKTTLARSRQKGRDGWDDPALCSIEFLADLLVGHLYKTNPGNWTDLGNLIMMLQQRQADPSVLTEALIRKKERDMTALKAACSVVLLTNTAVVLVDEDQVGYASVTNAAERVIEQLSARDALGTRRVIYRDSTGRFDELCHNGQWFTGFAPLTGSQQRFFAKLVDDASTTEGFAPQPLHA